MSGAHHTTNSPHDDDHGVGPPGADGNAFKAGHEADTFDVRGILYVPCLVVVCCVIAYVIVSSLFGYLGKANQSENAKSAELNAPDINDRFARISSTMPRPVAGDSNTIVAQPRLEYLKEMEKENANDKQFVRSKRGKDTPGSTYEIRPEDLRPEHYVDPITKQRMLGEAAYADEDKKFIRVPVNDVIKMFAEKKTLPVSKSPVVVTGLSNDKAKLSNGGRSAEKPTVVKETPKPEPKKEDPKPEPKKEEPKK